MVNTQWMFLELHGLTACQVNWQPRACGKARSNCEVKELIDSVKAVVTCLLQFIELDEDGP